MEVDWKQTKQAKSTSSSIAVISGQGTDGTIIPAADMVVGPFLVSDQTADPGSVPQSSLLCHYAKQYGCSIFELVRGKTNEITGSKTEKSKDIPDKPTRAYPESSPQDTATRRWFKEMVGCLSDTLSRGCSVCKCMCILYVAVVVLQTGLGGWGLMLVNRYCIPDTSGKDSFTSDTFTSIAMADGILNVTSEQNWERPHTSNRPKVMCGVYSECCCIGPDIESQCWIRSTAYMTTNFIGAIVLGAFQLFPLVTIWIVMIFKFNLNRPACESCYSVCISLWLSLMALMYSCGFMLSCIWFFCTIRELSFFLTFVW